MTTPDEMRGLLRLQGQACANLGSPFMARLMRLLAERLQDDCAVGHRLLHWPGNPAATADNPSLRLAGGLHALVISGSDPALAAVYPPHQVEDDRLWTQIAQTLRTQEPWLMDWYSRAPQTNEVRRAAAIVPALHMVAQATGLPLALWELGCSGGLNLRADLFRVEAGAVNFGPHDSPVALSPEWTGPVPSPVPLQIAQRHGVDLHPMDIASDAVRLRLRAYLWPDQPNRRAFTDAALALAQNHPAQVDRADAVAWLAEHLPQRPTNCATVIFHTVAWQYLPPEAQARGHAMIAKAGRDAPPEQPLAHLGMEGDGAPQSALTLTLWPGGTQHSLGRADWHGRSINWTGPTAVPPPRTVETSPNTRPQGDR